MPKPAVKKLKLKLARPTEKQIMQAIMAWVNANGGLAIRQQSGVFVPYGSGKNGGWSYATRIGFKGLSDIIGMWKGKFFAIEVKDWKGEVSAEQQHFIEIVKRLGGIAFVARSLEDVYAHLEL